MGRMTWTVALVLAAGCGRLGFESLHHGTDAGSNIDIDAAVSKDAGPSAVHDAVRDAGADAGRDASVDAALPLDAGFDASTSIGIDAGDDLDGGLDLGPPPAGDFCEDVHPLAAPALIDGVLEPGLALRSIPKDHWIGARPAPSDHDAAYAVAYRPDGLYVFIAVTATTRLPAPLTNEDHCGDAVEIYLDSDGAFPLAPSYDVPGTIQFVVAAPADDVTPSMRSTRWNNVTLKLGAWTSTEFGTFPTSTGYAFEGMFRAADLDLASWTLSPGNDIGLSVGIDVAVQAGDPDAQCGNRLGQYFNRVDTVSGLACGIGAYCSTYAFCSAPLLP